MTKVYSRQRIERSQRRRTALIGIAVSFALLAGGAGSFAATPASPESETRVDDLTITTGLDERPLESTEPEIVPVESPLDSASTEPIEDSQHAESTEPSAPESPSQVVESTESSSVSPVPEVQSSDDPESPLDTNIAPYADSKSFATENLDRYFSLVAPNLIGAPNQWKAHIRYIHMNGESNAFPVSQNSPEWLVKDLAIPPGRIPPAFTGGTTQRNPNALGVTEDGVFYFTNQYQQALLTANGKRHEFIDVWRYESDQPIAESTNPRRIISGMDLGETLNTENPQQIVAGAFNPFDEAFYFGMYQPEGIAADRKIQLKVFKAAISGNDWSAGLIGTALTPKGSFLSATNGDFDFDSAGNLTFLVSSQGTVADAYLGTINSEDIQAASTTTPATFEDFTISQKLTFSTGTSGGQANGMVFARSGQLVVQASDYQRMLNPNTFSETASINPFPPTGPSDRILTTDLASFASPPTVRVDKDVIARIDPTDQFALRLGDGAKYQSIHTNGVGGELDASGLQDRKLGPVGVYTGDTVTIGETMAPDSPTLDTTLYSPIFRCVNTELPITDPNYEVDLSDLGTGFERSLEVPATLPGSWKGPQVVCTITNEGQIPALTVSKTSDPETGVAVTEEQDVKYTLSFDNTAGTGAALEVDYTDHLKDVLDDAELDLSSLAVLDVTDPDTPLEVTDGFFAVYDADAQTIKIAGAKDGTGTATVPAKTKYTLSYTVSVKPNIGTEGKPREDSDNATAYKMTNFLVEGNDEVPEKCTAPGQDEDPVCTDHLVKTWTISKDSKPSNGAQLHHGGNIYYNLEVQKTDPSYQIDGIVVTDDLSEVLRVAEWDASAPVLDGTQARGIHMMDERGNVVRSLEASYVPAPVYNGTDRWTLTTVAFSLLPGEVSAQIWFAVKVGTPPQVAPHWLPESPSPGTHFTNRVSAAAGAQEPEANQCRTGITEGEIGGAVAACTVSHAVGADYFTVRKDGRGTLATGETLNLQNLLGHEFELRSDNDGSMGAVPGFMCESSSTPPALDSTESCARFYPIPTGQQAGRWRAERVPAGTYWLLETKAPTAQRVSATETRKVTGVQLLAEPIKFIVGEEAKFGQLDIFTPGTVLFEERCDPVNSPTFIACVNPSGYLMIVRDPGLLPLPVSGGNGVSALTFGALVLIGGGLGAGYLWRRNRYGQPTP